MFLKYNGKTENFKYKNIDFSKGPAEVEDAVGTEMLKANPRTFTQVISKVADAPEVARVPDAPEGPEGPKKSLRSLRQ